MFYFVHLVKFPFFFTSEYKANLKGESSTISEVTYRRAFFQAPLQMYLGSSCCLIFLFYLLITVTLVLCIMSWMKCAWPLLLLTLSLIHVQREKPTSTVTGEFICI